MPEQLIRIELNESQIEKLKKFAPSWLLNDRSKSKRVAWALDRYLEIKKNKTGGKE